MSGVKPEAMTDKLGKTSQSSLGPEVIKLLSCSTQLSMKFKLLLNTEIIKIGRKFGFRLVKSVIYVGIFTFMSKINFSLS